MKESIIAATAPATRTSDDSSLSVDRFRPFPSSSGSWMEEPMGVDDGGSSAGAVDCPRCRDWRRRRGGVESSSQESKSSQSSSSPSVSVASQRRGKRKS